MRKDPEVLAKRTPSSSAGSIVTTNSLRDGSEGLRQLTKDGAINLEMLGPEGQRSSRSLGLVGIELRSHYHSSNPKYDFVTDELLQKLADLANKKLYVLDDDSAIKIAGDSLDVVSEGTWKIFKPMA